MRILVLGGTAWLGGTVAQTALDRGHAVTALARGESGPVPAGVELVRADRSRPDAYAAVAERDWDAVVDVSRQPSHVRSALAALGERADHWSFVSSCSVYAAHDTPGADESAAVLPALAGDEATPETYGEGKVACEEAVLTAIRADRALVARAGLIAGPGDPTDRTGYWPLRFAHPSADDGAVLVPDSPGVGTQVVDVRDLAAWLLTSAERGTSGVMNAAGPVVPLEEHLATARRVAGHSGPVVAASPAWLAAQNVQEWAGERSLPLWINTPGWEGFGARDTSRALTSGLSTRPLEETLADTLAWEMRAGPGRPRRAGLTADEERALLALARS
ncbi:MAG TPA: NAD-dependent epimerase/dehydratase family protein [Pedococcus sp.]|nr:NAD-dependent epimerase/dehydratase family protein [Pedococcus sp.]